MSNNSNVLLEHLFSRDTDDPSVAVVDGYGLSLKVRRGHLIVEDGIGPHRRTRTYSRAQRRLRRLVILGHTGYMTLEAIRWCADIGVTLVHLDGDQRLLTVHGAPGLNDPRLRRAQAAAATSLVGLAITQELLGAKLDGQAGNLDLLDATQAANTIQTYADQLRASDDLAVCRDLESAASNAYFAAWSTAVACRFAARDRAKVPDHWTYFSVRSSPLHRGGRSPRNAADPVNALLNYSYALAESECRTACLAVGLDPGLGIVHTDKRNRDSLALDLLEVLRPAAERHILRLLHSRYFRASDFHETRHGACRLLAPTTHELAAQLPTFAKQIAAATESVAHSLANSSPGAIAIRTPLSRANTTSTQQRGQRSVNRRPSPGPNLGASCRTCGETLTESGRQLCPMCWPVTRRKLATERAKAGNAALADMRTRGVDPTNAPEAAAKRSTSLSQRKREELAWTPDPNDTDWTEDRYRLEILPRLAAVPLSRLEEVTGLSNSACSRIRSGKLTPHRRHWPKLAAASD